MVDYKNQIVQEDLARICQSNLNWNEFNNKTVLITGATGMLAVYLAYTFLYLREECGVNVRVMALCRTKAKAEGVYRDFVDKGFFSLLLQDICSPIDCDDNIDYIFHLAGNASPHFINNDPVGILQTNLIGTINVLELAQKKHAKVFFASTREVYGKNENACSLDEAAFGSIDPMENRSCYPESKRAAESLLRSYYVQFGVETFIARIAHSYGPGMKIDNDGRIMSDLIGNVVRGEDIVLKSSGDALRAFCYVSDAITGILYVVLKGKAGEAYNLANETEEIAIKELATSLAALSNGKSKVVFMLQTANTGYCNYKRVGLDTGKLEKLGWKPSVSLMNGLERTLKGI